MSAPRRPSVAGIGTRGVLLVAMMAGLSGCAGRALPDTTLTACYSGTDASSSAVLYAADHGFFDRNGLRVTLLFANGGSAAVATLLSGQSQICQMSGSNVVPAAQAGEDLVLVAGIVNTTPFRLIAAPTITRPEQLVGQTFASPAGGGSYELGLRLQLSSIGVPFEQVKFAPLGSQAAVIAAMHIISQSPPAPGARHVTAADVVDTSVVEELERAGAFSGTAP